VMIVVPSASRKDIWIGRDGGGSFKPGNVMNTNVSGLRVNLRVESNVVRLVSPGAADGVVIFERYVNGDSVEGEEILSCQKYDIQSGDLGLKSEFVLISFVISILFQHQNFFFHLVSSRADPTFSIMSNGRRN